ncbi:MAG: ABC transporter permease [Candidatus Thorarchaeota archaeon]|nr:MAG: ABC transporter permease [Candidatus Thorarchaeota archaeon]
MMSSPEQNAENAAVEKSRPHELPWFLESNIIRWALAGLILVLLWVIIAFFSRSTIIEVLEAFIILSTEGDSGGFVLADHAAQSLFIVTVGFCVAVATAVPLGIAMGRYSIADSVFGPVVEATRPIPPIAWIPLSLLIFTSLLSAQVFIIWIGAFFPILINTTTGVKRTEPVHIDVAKTFGASESRILTSVVIPSAAPEMFAGMRIGFGIGWMCLVAAEMIGSNKGLGYLIWTMQQVGWTGAVIASMLVIGLIGFLVSYVLLMVEKRLLRWRQGVAV